MNLLTQQQFTLSGYVRDMNSGKRLVNANIFAIDSSNGAITDSIGYYSIDLPVGDHEIIYSYVGYQDGSIKLNLTNDTTININLLIQDAIDEITVFGNDETLLASSEIGRISFSTKNVELLPTFLGESDVIKTIQLLPGIQSGNEGTSGLYIRGGGPDQNLILLNGTPLYNIDHLFGFFSIFNQDAVKDISLYKGGFPARFGGRLSSVVDISMKEGDDQEFHGSFSLGMIASKISLEGPIKKGKTSFLISARRTYADMLVSKFLKNQNKDNTVGNYYFYDLNASITHKFSNRSRLYSTFYMGKDDAFADITDNYTSFDIDWNEKTKFNLAWGNLVGSLRWNYTVSDKLSLNTSLSYIKYQFDVLTDHDRTNKTNIDQERYYLSYKSGIEDKAFKFDFTYIPHTSHTLKFGANYTHHRYTPVIQMVDLRNRYYRNEHVNDTINNIQNSTGQELFFYVEDDIKISQKLSVNAGLHMSIFFVQGNVYKSFEPRITSYFNASNKVMFKAFYSQMTQYVHLLSGSSINLPTDLWLPATKRIKPQESRQAGLGASIKLNKAFHLNIESFYKEMDNIIEYKDGATFMNSMASWEDKIDVGKGWSYGIETLLQKSTGKTIGWLGYTLAWSERKFENINFGEKFPARFDRRHDISLAIVHKFSEKFDIGMTWVYGTGNAVTLPTQEYYSSKSTNPANDNMVVAHIESRNNYRMADYHRLDLNMSFHKKKKRGMRTWKIGFYNAYSRNNPFFLRFGYDKNREVEKIINGKIYTESAKVLKQVSLFPIIPSVTYCYKF